MADLIQVQNSVDTTTTNATPTVVITHALNDDSFMLINVLVAAMNDSGSAAGWQKACCVKKVSGTVSLVPSLVGSITDIVSPFKNLGAASWSVNISVDDTDGLVVEIQGQASTEIRWIVQLTGVHYQAS